MLKRLATARNIIMLLVAFLIYNLALMQPMYARIETYSGGVGAIDMLFSYTPERAYEMITAYGEQGRRYYATIALTLDTVFPLLIALLLGLLLTYVLTRTYPPESAMHQLRYLPVGAMLADLLENAGIVTMLLSYPGSLFTVARLTSRFSTAKWLLVAGQSALLVVVLIRWLIKALRSR